MGLRSVGIVHSIGWVWAAIGVAWGGDVCGWSSWCTDPSVVRWVASLSFSEVQVLSFFDGLMVRLCFEHGELGYIVICCFGAVTSWAVFICRVATCSWVGSVFTGCGHIWVGGVGRDGRLVDWWVRPWCDVHVCVVHAMCTRLHTLWRGARVCYACDVDFVPL